MFRKYKLAIDYIAEHCDIWVKEKFDKLFNR
jgi:hypothetical protein